MTSSDADFVLGGECGFNIDLDKTKLAKFQNIIDTIKKNNGTMGNAEIENLKKEAASLYKDLHKQFAANRVDKLNDLLANAAMASKIVDRNFVRFKHNAINRVPGISKRFSTELISSYTKKKKKNDKSSFVDDPIPILASSPPPTPPTLPENLDIPYLKKGLSDLVQEYSSPLKCSRNKYIYQRNLIERKTAITKRLIWLQFSKDSSFAKEKELQSLNKELFELSMEHNPAFSNINNHFNDTRARLTVPEEVLNKRVHKDLTNKIRNQIETKKEVFASNTVRPKANHTYLKGLNREEIDSDLALMSFWKSNEDQNYRGEIQNKITEARKTVEKEFEDSKARIDRLSLKRARNAAKGVQAFIEERKECFGKSAEFLAAHHALINQQSLQWQQLEQHPYSDDAHSAVQPDPAHSAPDDTPSTVPTKDLPVPPNPAEAQPAPEASKNSSATKLSFSAPSSSSPGPYAAVDNSRYSKSATGITTIRDIITMKDRQKLESSSSYKRYYNAEL